MEAYTNSKLYYNIEHLGENCPSVSNTGYLDDRISSDPEADFLMSRMEVELESVPYLTKKIKEKLVKKGITTTFQLSGLVLMNIYGEVNGSKEVSLRVLEVLEFSPDEGKFIDIFIDKLSNIFPGYIEMERDDELDDFL